MPSGIAIKSSFDKVREKKEYKGMIHDYLLWIRCYFLNLCNCIFCLILQMIPDGNWEVKAAKNLKLEQGTNYLKIIIKSLLCAILIWFEISYKALKMVISRDLTCSCDNLRLRRRHENQVLGPQVLNWFSSLDPKKA